MSKALAWLLFVAYLAAWAPGFVYDGDSMERVGTLDIVWGVSFLAFAAVGLFLALRRPANPIGWLLMAGSALVGAGVSLGEYTEAVGIDSESIPAVLELLLPLGLLAYAAAFVLFPTGRYPTRWVAWSHWLALALLPFASTLFPSLDGGPVIGMNLAVPVVALLYRLVAGDGVMRRQVAAPLLPIAFGLLVLVVLGFTGLNDSAGVGEIIGVFAVVTITVGAPIGIGVAVSRYRLYEIDRIISRTVTYAIVVGFLAGVVALVAALVGTLFDEPLVVAATTLGVAAVFNPLRRRVQSWVERRLPGGVVTFFFSDIEGSTHLWDVQPSEMDQAVSAHDQIVGGTIEGHNGVVFKTGGDSFCAAFDNPRDALAAAVATQLALADQDWPVGEPIKVRIGLNSGEAYLRDRDYFGPTLNRTARLMDAGHGGQVLAAASTYRLIMDDPTQEVSLRSLGTHHLKDLNRPEEIFQVEAPGLPSGFPPLRLASGDGVKSGQSGSSGL
jgi:class 3 adenylate cyclase